MAEWTRNKVDGSEINNGNEYEKKDRVSRQQLNSIVNNSLYASDVAYTANENSQNAIAMANEALEQARSTGTRITVGGEFQSTFDADTKANKSELDSINEQVVTNSQNITTKTNLDASNLTDENVESWQEKLGVNNKLDYYSWITLDEQLTINGTVNTYTQADISSLITDYDENGEYEIYCYSVAAQNTKSNQSLQTYTDMLGNSDVPIRINFMFAYDYSLREFNTFILPIKKYLYVQKQTTTDGYVAIMGYRRVK